MECHEHPGVPLYQLDYKAMCTSSSRAEVMVAVVAVELVLLVALLAKLAKDCVLYRRTGHLPWLARRLCWHPQAGLGLARPPQPRAG